jgi:UDP-N-acetylmuramoylalanine--D-glutamate ligase
MTLSLAGRRITILGWARSGRPAARLAVSLGAEVFVSEGRRAEQMDAVALEEIAPYEHELGGHTSRALDADAIILSPGIPPSNPILKGFRGELWSEIELAYRTLPCPIVAVTGTNGKTTTTTLLGELLKAGYTKGTVHVGGNIGTAATSLVENASSDDVVVLEVSSFQLETIVKFRPKIAVWLNLRSDHLDRYADLEEYAAAKERIFLNMHPEDVAIVNIDDPWSCALAERLNRGPGVVTVSATGPADYVLESAYDERLLEAVKAPENLLAAVAAAERMGVPREAMAEVFANFRGLPHRIEPVGAAGGVKFYNDSKATNVHSVEAALKRLEAPVVLIMGGRDKGENYREIDALIRDKCRAVVAYGEAAARIAESVCAGAGAAGPSGSTTAVEIVPRFDDAVFRAYELAKPDASVLLSPACSSYDQFSDYGARGDRFREVARAIAGMAR